MYDAVMRFSLEVQQAQVSRIVPAKQNDSARRLEITLTDGGLPYRIAEGCTAVLTVKKPSGLTVYNECGIDGDIIVYQLTQADTDEVGMALCEVTVFGSTGEQLTFAAFEMLVSEAMYAGATVRVLMSPGNVKAGQYLRVKSVDDKGMVAELESVSGGAGGGAGASAYEIAVENGFEGTEEEWLESLKGAPGAAGEPGYTPVKGTDYYTEEEKTELVNEVKELVEETNVTAIDFTNFANGSFTETVNGATVNHTVTFDDSGRPVTVDDVAITWGDA